MKSLLFKISFLLFFCSPVLANDLLIFYSNNEGSNTLDLDVTQDLQNNEIEGQWYSGASLLYGKE